MGKSCGGLYNFFVAVFVLKGEPQWSRQSSVCRNPASLAPSCRLDSDLEIFSSLGDAVDPSSLHLMGADLTLLLQPRLPVPVPAPEAGEEPPARFCAAGFSFLQLAVLFLARSGGVGANVSAAGFSRREGKRAELSRSGGALGEESWALGSPDGPRARVGTQPLADGATQC